MAANFQDDQDEMITEINVVPLVDIILVVLIIFMLTANLIAKQSLKLELPEAATGEGAETTTLALTLDKDGMLYLNGQPTTEAELSKYLPTVVEADPKAQAIIAADKGRSHGEVIHLIDFVRQHGIYKFALNIDPVAPTVPIDSGAPTPDTAEQ